MILAHYHFENHRIFIVNSDQRQLLVLLATMGTEHDESLPIACNKCMEVCPIALTDVRSYCACSQQKSCKTPTCLNSVSDETHGGLCLTCYKGRNDKWVTKETNLHAKESSKRTSAKGERHFWSFCFHTPPFISTRNGLSDQTK